MQRCPNCRARLQAGDTCRRCGMELSLLLRVEREAERLLGSAVQLLASGDAAEAERRLQQARQLRRDPLAERLLGWLAAME